MALGGSITGERGIGLSKKQYLEKAIGQSNYDLMKSLKILIDPRNILYPGNIFLD